jgi:hypothetical protein
VDKTGRKHAARRRKNGQKTPFYVTDGAGSLTHKTLLRRLMKNWRELVNRSRPDIEMDLPKPGVKS